MSITIDIRDVEVGEIDQIIFADKHSGYFTSQVRKEEDWDSEFLVLEDCDGDDAHKIKYEDIDNLILALQKAKELWSKQ